MFKSSRVLYSKSLSQVSVISMMQGSYSVNKLLMYNTLFFAPLVLYDNMFISYSHCFDWSSPVGWSLVPFFGSVAAVVSVFSLFCAALALIRSFSFLSSAMYIGQLLSFALWLFVLLSVGQFVHLYLDYILLKKSCYFIHNFSFVF